MKGLTLIEFIIYIAILGAVLVLMVGFSWNIIHSDIKTMAYREAQQNSRFAMEKITRAIRAGHNPLTVFTLNNGIIYQNGAALTTDQVRATGLGFTNINNAYKINLSIEYYNPDNRLEYEASVDLETTSMPRQ